MIDTEFTAAYANPGQGRLEASASWQGGHCCHRPTRNLCPTEFFTTKPKYAEIHEVDRGPQAIFMCSRQILPGTLTLGTVWFFECRYCGLSFHV